MQLAYQLALQAACLDEVPVGAVITAVIDGQEQIIATGHNQTIGLQQTQAHAEMQALAMACRFLNNYRLNDCRIYITMEPCLMCAGAMIHARISDIYYLLPDVKTGVAESNFNVFTLPFNHHASIHKYDDEVLANAYLELLQGFFRQKRAKN